jgi:hypothetical protein
MLKIFSTLTSEPLVPAWLSFLELILQQKTANSFHIVAFFKPLLVALYLRFIHNFKFKVMSRLISDHKTK